MKNATKMTVVIERDLLARAKAAALDPLSLALAFSSCFATANAEFWLHRTCGRR